MSEIAPVQRGKNACTRGRIREIARLVRDGTPPTQAAQATGIAGRTFRRWMEQGRNDAEAGDTTSRYAKLHDAVKRAEAETEADVSALLKKAAEGDWRAAEAFLKRRFPQRWSETVNVHLEAMVAQFHAKMERVAFELTTAFEHDPQARALALAALVRADSVDGASLPVGLPARAVAD